jgi:mono/diheme cytochrome c family protein
MKMKLKYTSKIALGLLLLGCLAGWSARADAPAAWGANCAACHGKDGKGNTMMGRKLSIKDLTSASFTDAQATDAIKNGVTEGGAQKMKAFGDKLSDADIAALVAYIHTLK